MLSERGRRASRRHRKERSCSVRTVGALRFSAKDEKVRSVCVVFPAREAPPCQGAGEKRALLSGSPHPHSLAASWALLGPRHSGAAQT